MIGAGIHQEGDEGRGPNDGNKEGDKKGCEKDGIHAGAEIQSGYQPSE